MDYSILGWPGDGPTLHLDHERFAYAGKFVLPSTGKAVAREDNVIVAAAAFDADRTDGTCLRVRYVTVRDDRREAGIGPRLLALVVDRARDRGFADVKAGVNNPLAYEAFYKSGLAYTGERTGLAELVCEWPAPDGRSGARYRAGLDRFRAPEREPSEVERAFLETREGAAPPPVDADGTVRN